MMRKRPTRYPFIVLASCILVSCGNKGELFLAPDDQLVQELDAVSERIGDPAADSTEEELPENADKPAKKMQEP